MAWQPSYVVVDVEHEERYWYPDDGGIVWLAGYHPVGPDGRFLARDALGELRIAGVAGAARFHPDALAAEAAAPGRPLVLRRDAGNEHDPNAVAVDLPDGSQLGFVPRELAVEIAADVDAGRVWSAVVLREQRASPRDPRAGVTMLLAPDSRVELRVRS
jgi:HIRAN domain